MACGKGGKSMGGKSKGGKKGYSETQDNYPKPTKKKGGK